MHFDVYIDVYMTTNFYKRWESGKKILKTNKNV